MPHPVEYAPLVGIARGELGGEKRNRDQEKERREEEKEDEGTAKKRLRRQVPNAVDRRHNEKYERKERDLLAHLGDFNE